MQNDCRLQTALMIVELKVENNQRCKRQPNIISSISQSGSSAPPPCVCGASSDQILQLGPLAPSRTFYNAAFGQRHNLRSSSSPSDERPLGPRTDKEQTSCVRAASLPAVSDGDGGHILSKVARCALAFPLDDPLLLSRG